MRYTPESYAHSVAKACLKAFPPPGRLRPKKLPSGRRETVKDFMARLGEAERAELAAWKAAHHWHPNQFRHLALTDVRKRFGLEAAQTVGGHNRADVTQIYAERDLALAAKVAAAEQSESRPAPRGGRGGRLAGGRRPARRWRVALFPHRRRRPDPGHLHRPVAPPAAPPEKTEGRGVIEPGLLGRAVPKFRDEFEAPVLIITRGRLSGTPVAQAATTYLEELLLSPERWPLGAAVRAAVAEELRQRATGQRQPQGAIDLAVLLARWEASLQIRYRDDQAALRVVKAAAKSLRLRLDTAGVPLGPADDLDDEEDGGGIDDLHGNEGS
jgi:hypothetical protein